jgi:ATP-dependent Lon protease
MRGDRVIFLVPQTDLSVDNPTRRDIYDVGTVAKVRQVLKIAEDGVRVLVEGMWRAKVENFVNINNTTFAEVTVLNEKVSRAKATYREALIRRVHEAFAKFAVFTSSARFVLSAIDDV